MKRALLVLAALLAACSSSSSDGTNAAPDSSTGADASFETDTASLDTDLEAETDPDAPSGALTVPATNGTWTAKEDVTFTGKGAGDLGAISITHGVGTLVFKGTTTPAFFYTSTSAPPGTDDSGTFAGDRDFELVAATPDRLLAVWITCTGSALTFVYFESTDGPLTSTERAASGTFTVTTADTPESISLPALAIAPPALATGFTLSGTLIKYDGTAPGTASIGGTSLQVYPFHQIDCTKCATPGWWELHSLLYDPTSESLSFGILYLAQNRPDLIELAFLIRLPQLDDPIGEQLDDTGTWTTP